MTGAEIFGTVVALVRKELLVRHLNFGKRREQSSKGADYEISLADASVLGLFFSVCPLDNYFAL
jgi:hypothetical protein